MIPAYRRSVSSLMPLDLNQDQNHELLFSPNFHHSSPSSSSFSSLSYPILFNSPDQNQEGSHYCEPKQLPNIHEEAEKTIPCSGSCDHSTAETEKQCESRKVTVWKKEENHEATTEDGSLKWMSSKMRMMRKMMVSDQGNSMQQNDQKQPLSPLGTDNSSSSNNYYSNNTTVRVCADCHTTKTPLWRSGPRGPKSLCNACGIRQRKARRAMAAASASGTILMATETSVKRNKLQKKEKKNKSKIESPQHMKKKHNLEAKAKPSKSKKKFGFEDLTLRLSKNLALQKVFPQDEKEAAILLMALSYGLVHG